MRATSTEVMQALRALTDMVTAGLLAMLLFGWGDWSQDSTMAYEIILRLLAIYALQIIARVYISLAQD